MICVWIDILKATEIVRQMVRVRTEIRNTNKEDPQIKKKNRTN